jgi:hypothetical protein
LHRKVYEWAYVQQDSEEFLPDVPDVVFDAFKSQKLKHLKITKEAFLCFFGVWRSITLSALLLMDGQSDNLPMKLPIPQTARIIPFNTSCWNVEKGGSDTITKLIELCQERIGIRSENNVALARLLLYHGVVYHRLNQILSSEKNLEQYGTLYHWRNASSHRSTMADSLEKFSNTLLRFANNNTSGRATRSSRISNDQSIESLPSPFGAFSPVLFPTILPTKVLR